MARKKKFISQEYSAEAGGKNLKEGTKKSRTANVFTTIFFSFSLLLGVSLISFTVMFFFSEVNGSSMMSYLNSNYFVMGSTDSVLANKHTTPKRGDVIVVEHYDENEQLQEYHIKRLLATGGERIRFDLSADKKHYIIYINGIPEAEYEYSSKLDPYYAQNVTSTQYNDFYRYLNNPDNPPASYLYRGAGYALFRTHDHRGDRFVQYVEESGKNEIVLPDDYIFYMGDNRGGPTGSPISADCTYYGPQLASSVIGTVVEKIENKSAPQWAIDKLIYFFTFKWL